jgi:hypothetical protein
MYNTCFEPKRRTKGVCELFPQKGHNYVLVQENDCLNKADFKHIVPACGTEEGRSLFLGCKLRHNYLKQKILSDSILA